MSERDRRGSVLLSIARDAIRAAPESEPPFTWPESWLCEPGASFVTLLLEGELRGCIGSIEPVRPLGEDVHANARAAAYRDPRFPPLPPADIASLQVEVSVLSPRSVVPAPSEDDAVAALRPGVDGLVLEYDGRRATFLPQVWEGLPDPLAFLSQLRLKANLPPRFWHPSVRLSRYTVEKYR
jgi:AmmeMemoRadiSam system protein A